MEVPTNGKMKKEKKKKGKKCLVYKEKLREVLSSPHLFSCVLY